MNPSEVIRRQVTVTLENGLHMVPSSEIAKLVRDYPGRVVIRREQIQADARSVLDLLQLKAEFGTTLEVEAEGDGAADVVQGIVRLFELKFQVPRAPATPARTDQGGS